MNYTQEQLERWNKILESFSHGTINPLSYNQWIKPIQLYSVTSSEIIATSDHISLMGPLVTRYKTMLESAVRASFGEHYSFKLLDPRDVEREAAHFSDSNILDKYRFENFVVGSSNSFAYAAALAVAEDPSEVYNPLFIWGDVGLGKTHLMNAIGNYILQSNPAAKILFTTSERFTNDFIDTIVKKKGTSDLRQKMRSVDVLMVDDIQFLAKTNATQEEFFHTFNELYENKKQIIVSSDRPPQELPALAERLRSRFNWGLIVDIQRPDFETRVAILRKKADEESMDVPYDVIEYIAAHFDKSIRDLEGALTRVNAQARLTNTDLTLQFAESALSSLITSNDSRVVDVDRIMDVIAKRFSVSKEGLTSSKRSRDVAIPRQIAMYLCRELTDMSTTNIGKAFGGRDHTTVLHGCEKVAEQINSDFAFKKKVEDLTELIKNG